MGPGRSLCCPARLDHPTSGRGASILSCGELEANPGAPPTDWGEEDYAVVSDLVTEACARLGISPVRDAFATPANHRFPAYWTREDDAFAQPWDYPPFVRLEEVVTKAAREGCLMLVIAPEWPGPVVGRVVCPVSQTVAATVGPARVPAGGTDLMPAPRWRTWAFLLDFREGVQARMPAPPPPILP